MPLDVDRLRADTPACDHVIHLNNAGASLPPTVVTDAVVDHVRLEAELGGYEAAAVRAADLGRLPPPPSCIGAAPDEIATFDSATRAWNAAFWALALSQRWRPGDRILTARAEYASNYLSLLQAERFLGTETVVIPTDEAGALDADAAGRPPRRAGAPGRCHPRADPRRPGEPRRGRRTGVPRGGRAVPARRLPVGRAPAGRRRRDRLRRPGDHRPQVPAGPRGTGFLYVRRSLAESIEPAGADLVGATWTAPHEYRLEPGARRFEQFEGSYGARLGLGAALAYLLELGIVDVSARMLRSWRRRARRARRAPRRRAARPRRGALRHRQLQRRRRRGVRGQSSAERARRSHVDCPRSRTERPSISRTAA